MKIAMMILRLLLPAATIVLAVLTMNAQGDERTALLAGCMACLALTTVLNMRAQRKQDEQQ